MHMHTHTHTYTHTHVHTHTCIHAHTRTQTCKSALVRAASSNCSASCWARSSCEGGWSSTKHSLYITIQFVWRKKAAELSLGWVYSSNLCSSQNCFGANLIYMYLVQFNTTYKQKARPFIYVSHIQTATTPFFLSYTLILCRLGIWSLPLNSSSSRELLYTRLYVPTTAQ